MNQFLALIDKSTRIAFAVAFAGLVVFYAWPQTFQWMIVPTLIAVGVLLARLLMLLGKGVVVLSNKLWNWGWRQTAIFRVGNLTPRWQLALLWIANHPRETIHGSPLEEPYRSMLRHGFLFTTDSSLFPQAFKVNRCVYWHQRKIGKNFAQHTKDGVAPGRPRNW